MSQHSQRSNESNTDNCKVYISNINKSIEEEDIRRKFSQFGVIKSLILKKKENNVTYSFIEYEKSAQAKAAISEMLYFCLAFLYRMDKKTYFDRVLKVEYGKGGHRGLEHYHTNRYEQKPQSRQRADRSRPKNYSPKKKSHSYESKRSYDRYKKSGSRSPRDRYRYKPYPEKIREHRDRSRSYERASRYERRDYQDDYRKPYRDDYDNRYREDKYRDQDKYRSYRRDRSEGRGDYAKDGRRDYDKDDRRDYDKDRRKDYREPKQGDRPKQERYYNDAERFKADTRYAPNRFDKHSSDRPNDYSKDRPIQHSRDRPADYNKDRASEYNNKERTGDYNKERTGDYNKDYRREPYERRKEYPAREEQGERKESKDYAYVQRPNYERRNSPNREAKPQYQRAE